MTDTIRFGLGNPEGMRSDSWNVRAGSDGSIYITPRGLPHGTRGNIKVSLHPVRPDGSGGRWKIEHQSHFIASRPDLFVDGDLEPVIAEWDSETQRLGDDVPIRQGFGIALGRFSLGPNVVADDPEVADEQRRYLAKAEWLRDLPGVDEAWQWTVLVGDPGQPISPVGTRSLDAVVAGLFDMEALGMVYVMRHLFPVTVEMKERLKAYAERLPIDTGSLTGPTVLRGSVIGKEDEGFRWVAELALSYGFPPEALEIA